MAETPSRENRLPASFYEAMMVVVEVVDRVARKVNARGHGQELSVPQQRVVAQLRATDDATHRTIGRALGMESAQISRVAQQLAQLGLITTTPSPHHKRQSNLNLTDAGRQLADENHRARLVALEEEFEQLGAADQSIIERSLFNTQNAVPRSGIVETTYMPLGVRHLPGLLSFLARGIQAELGWNENYIGYLSRLLKICVERNPGRPFGWAALKRNSIVGACVWTPGRLLVGNDLGDDGHAMIGALFVTPDFRLAGIGEELLARCCRDTQDLTYETFVVTVPQRQQPLLRLLRKHRFQRNGSAEATFQYGKMEKLVQLRLNLRSPLRPVRRHGSKKI